MSITTVVLYSGGMGSFLTATLLKFVEKRENIILYFNDTKSEDEDLYRFLKESVEWLDLPLVEDSDGRNIYEIFKDNKFMGNSRVDLCSRLLKRERSRKWIKNNFKPDEVEIAVGIDWTEIHRYEKAYLNWLPFKLIAPLIDHDINKKSFEEKILKISGIKRSRMYDYGFSHDNCAGRCVKAGLAHYRNLWEKLPERYLQAEREEELVYEVIGKPQPFLKKTIDGETFYMTLREYREIILEAGKEADEDEKYDYGGCGCAL